MALKKSVKRILVFGLPALVVIGVTVAVIVGKSNGKGTAVQADLAYVDDISELVTASGRIQPQTKVDITAEVSAEITGVFVTEGDQVTRGQRLLLLDTIQYQSDVMQAKFSLDEALARTAAARTSYDRDSLEYDRQTKMYSQNMTSETAYTDARLALENSRANYQAMQAQTRTLQARLEQAQDNLTKTSITAPMDGMITYLSAEVGEIAQAQTSFTQGRTLMTVSDLSVFEVEVEVDESEIAKLRVDQSTKVSVDAFRDTVFAGTVVEIGNSAIIKGQGTDDYSTMFRVKIRLAATDAAIRPGMSSTVDITTAVAQSALLIPYASVVTRELDPDSLKADSAKPGSGDVMAATSNNENTIIATTSGIDSSRDTSTVVLKHKKERKSGVFVVRNRTAKFFEISTGIADDRNIVALTGLQPQDTVISGSFQTLRRLKDGDPVTIEQASLDKMAEKK
jgi:HlyD family secretion protein